jgi:hypothetical protein
MSRLQRKSVLWHYVTTGFLVALWMALQVTSKSFDESFLEVIFSNYIIPLVIFTLVLVSMIIKEHDELLSLLLILFATYVHLIPGIEKNFLITYVVLILFPILFLIRAVQFIKRKGLRDFPSYLKLLLLLGVYIYLIFH